jgi:hypothetical protein
METMTGLVVPSSQSIYTTTGDVLMIAAALAGLVTWWRTRGALVVSAPANDEEE